MSVKIAFPASQLVAFLRALGFTLEEDAPLLLAERTVAGERVLAFFYPLRGSSQEAIRDAVRTLSRAGRSEPGAAMHVITTAGVSLSAKDSQQFADIDSKVSSESAYLTNAILGRKVCQQIVEEAEQYIPDREYVEQWFAPGSTSAETFLREWMISEDAGLLVVLGQAGHGKTCLANHLARRLAEQHLQDPEKPVPFLFSLHRHRHVRRFEELVLTHLQDRGVHGFTSSAFAHLVNVGRVLPVLDGFDELAETGGLKVARETLRGLISQIDPHAKVLLTSRQAYFRHRGDLSLLGREEALNNLQTAELEPFDEQQREVFLQKRGLRKEQIQKVQAHVRNVGSEELLASPLVLGILAEEVKAGGTLEGASATDVFGLSLRRICEREKPKGRFPWEPDKQIEFLTGIADLMHEENAYELLDCDEWLAEVLEQDIPRGLARVKREEELNARIVQMKNHPLMSALVIQGGDALRFPHPLYRDFFVAREFKRSLAYENRVRNAVRLGLPEASARFLGDLLTEVDLAGLLDKCIAWRENVRDICACVLAKCDAKSKSDIDARTQEFLSCLGDRRSLEYENLSRLRFSLLRLSGFSFQGTDFTDSTFQSCEFTLCDFHGARMGGCRLYECSSDEQTAAALEELGIPQGAVEKRLFRASVVPVQNEDPVRDLVVKFFSRFIRKEAGTNQRTAAKRSMFGGLGGEERKFTEREVIPEMKKNGVIRELQALDVYEFNADWQSDGDSIMVLGGQPTTRVQRIMRTLSEKADKYNLV